MLKYFVLASLISIQSHAGGFFSGFENSFDQVKKAAKEAVPSPEKEAQRIKEDTKRKVDELKRMPAKQVDASLNQLTSDQKQKLMKDIKVTPYKEGFVKVTAVRKGSYWEKLGVRSGTILRSADLQ